MTRVLRPLLSLLSLCQLPLITATADGFDEKAHETLSLRAVLESRLDRYLKDELGLLGGRLESIAADRSPQALTGSVDQWVGSGAVEEDWPSLRVRHHFHNPTVPWDQAGLRCLGLILGESSAIWAQDGEQVVGGPHSWYDARAAFAQALTSPTREDRDTALSRTFSTLGHLIHLVQDAATPAHTRNDCHPIFIDTDRFHTWADANTDRILASPSVPFDPSILELAANPRAPIPIARIIDTERFRQTAIPPTSVRAGLAEFSHANFFSDDTLFKHFPFPSATTATLGPPEATGRRKLRRYVRRTIRETDDDQAAIEYRLAVPSALWNHIPNALVDQQLELDDLVFEDYGQLLFPRAIGYSAGLLDYFFRGTLDLALVEDPFDPSLLRLSGTNASPDTLAGGALRLYADDAHGQRSPGTPVDPDLTVFAESGAPLVSARFQAPADAERFVAVYTGTEGRETATSAPGAVIGKVLGGVRVEELFADGSRWWIRTPKGVFLLPLRTADFEQVTWGDAADILVARSPLGPGRPNRVVAYELGRRPGTLDPATIETADGTEVRLQPKQEAPFPFDMPLGTTVEFTSQLGHRQQLARIDYRIVNEWRPFDDGGGIYVAGVELGPVQVETVQDQAIPVAETFPLVLDMAHHAGFGTEYGPYRWRLHEVGADTSGRLLGLVSVDLIGPSAPTVVAPRYGVGADGGLEVVGDRPVVSPFAWRTLSPLWALVDLAAGRVVASTAEPILAIDVRSVDEESPDAPVVWTHHTEQYRGGYLDGMVTDLGWQRESFRPALPTDATVMTAEWRLDRGIQALTITGLVREEFARLGRFNFDVTSTSGFRDYVGLCNAGCVGIRVTTVGSGIGSQPLRLGQARRARPAPGDERLALLGLGEAGGFEETGTVFAWDPGAADARVLLDAREGDHFLGPATGTTAMLASEVLLPFERFTALLPLAGDELPIVFPDVDLTGAFTLLAPRYLYQVDESRFYRLAPPLTPTALPAKLVDFPAATVGDYHTIRLP